MKVISYTSATPGDDIAVAPIPAARTLQNLPPLVYGTVLAKQGTEMGLRRIDGSEITIDLAQVAQLYRAPHLHY